MLNEREIALLKKALKPHQAVIAANKILRKELRDHDAMAMAYDKINRIQGWIKDKPPEKDKPRPVAAPVPVRVADFTMTIHTVEDLEKCFKEIVFKNADVLAPPEVHIAYRKLLKDFIRSEEWRFQRDDRPNCQFLGIDGEGNNWDCHLKITSTRRSNAEIEILKRLKISSLEKWKKHDILIGVKR